VKLTEFDYKVIKLIKHSAFLPRGITKKDFLTLYKETYADVKTLEHLARRFLALNDHYHWFTTVRFAEMLVPSKHFSDKEEWYPFQLFGDPNKDRWDLIWSVINSCVMLTDCDLIPGYREWFDAQG